MADHLDQAEEVLPELERFADDRRSEQVRTGALELRAQIAAAKGDFAEAAELMDEFVRRRGTYLQLTGLSVLGHFYAISWHVHAGDPVAIATLRRAWDVLVRHGGVNPSWRAASATAVALTALGQRELALRFLCWADHVKVGQLNGLALFADELERFDLPLDPDGPVEDLDTLLGELDFL